MTEMRKMREICKWLRLMEALYQNYQMIVWCNERWHQEEILNPAGTATLSKKNLMEYQKMWIRFLGHNMVGLLGGWPLDAGSWNTEEEEWGSP